MKARTFSKLSTVSLTTGGTLTHEWQNVHPSSEDEVQALADKDTVEVASGYVAERGKTEKEIAAEADRVRTEKLAKDKADAERIERERVANGVKLKAAEAAQKKADDAAEAKTEDAHKKKG